MSQSTCQLDDCERVHIAKGYCKKHYDLLKRRGSVDAPPRRIPGNVCSLDGCGFPASARGYCAMHYQRSLRGGPGEVGLRGWGEGYQRGDVRPCWWCEKEFPVSDGRTRYCSKECAWFVKSLWNVAKYGITREDYRDAWKRQGGLCASCRRPERTVRNRLLCIDHDHVTGRFRGLLCSHCNRAIGLLQDDPAVITAAAMYVQREVIHG